MADITKCTGEGCSKRNSCYRHMAEEGMRQSYFLDVPLEIIRENDSSLTEKCNYYFPMDKLC